MAEQNNTFNPDEMPKLYPEDLAGGELLRTLTRDFDQDMTQMNFLRVVSCLRDSYVWMPCKVNLTAEQMQQIQAGGTPPDPRGIPMMPDVLSDGQNAYLAVFSGEDQIGNEYGTGYMMMEKSFMECVDMADANPRLAGILLDAYSVPFGIERKYFPLIRQLPSNLVQEDEEGTAPDETV